MCSEDIEIRATCHQRTKQLFPAVQHKRPMLEAARENRDAVGPGLHGHIRSVV